MEEGWVEIGKRIVVSVKKPICSNLSRRSCASVRTFSLSCESLLYLDPIGESVTVIVGKPWRLSLQSTGPRSRQGRTDEHHEDEASHLRAGASIGSLYQFFPTKEVLAESPYGRYVETIGRTTN
jgi:hypothetical protein